MLPTIRIPPRLLRYLVPALTIAVVGVGFARIIDRLYRPRAVIARGDHRLVFAALWSGRPPDNRLNIYRTIKRRGAENDAFDAGPVELSPDGNMVAVIEHEHGSQFHDVILEILNTSTGASLFFSTDVSLPLRVWLATDADAPAFLVAAQAQMAAENPDWTGVLDAVFVDDALNDIRLEDWIADGVVVGGSAVMLNEEFYIQDTVDWWRAYGRDAMGQFSIVLAEGVGAHPYTPLPATVPIAAITVGPGTPDQPGPLLIDGVPQTTPMLAPGVRYATGIW